MYSFIEFNCDIYLKEAIIKFARKSLKPIFWRTYKSLWYSCDYVLCIALTCYIRRDANSSTGNFVVVLERERQQIYFGLESKIVGAAEYGISYESTVGWRECVIVYIVQRETWHSHRKYIFKCVKSNEVFLFLSFSDAIIVLIAGLSKSNSNQLCFRHVMPKSEQVLIMKMCWAVKLYAPNNSIIFF